MEWFEKWLENKVGRDCMMMIKKYASCQVCRNWGEGNVIRKITINEKNSWKIQFQICIVCRKKFEIQSERNLLNMVLTNFNNTDYEWHSVKCLCRSHLLQPLLLRFSSKAKSEQQQNDEGSAKTLLPYQPKCT